jgi:hypothetical protein
VENLLRPQEEVADQEVVEPTTLPPLALVTPHRHPPPKEATEEQAYRLIRILRVEAVVGLLRLVVTLPQVQLLIMLVEQELRRPSLDHP